jgi:DNA-binding GntR family transcriptional regulator
MSGGVFEQIHPISKKDRIVTVMKEAIISGKLNSGDPLVENRIAQQFKVGQPLVREALIELEHQGFVQRFPYRGTIVTTLNRDDVEQIFRLRIELESLAIEWAKPNTTPADIAMLRGFVARMESGAKELDLAQFYENDLALHEKIWELSGNKYLADMLKRTVVPLFAFFLMKTARAHVSYLENTETHRVLIESLATEDGAGLRQRMKESMSNWRDDMVSGLFP